MLSEDLFSSSMLFLCIFISESKISGIRIFHFVIILDTLLGLGVEITSITVIILKITSNE